MRLVQSASSDLPDLNQTAMKAAINATNRVIEWT